MAKKLGLNLETPRFRSPEDDKVNWFSRLGRRMSSQPRPVLSLVVVIYNMEREAPRMIHSLSPAYQRDIDAADYEVIVVDNGSVPPFDSRLVASAGSNFRLIRIDPAPPSPAFAVNRGIAEARGDVIGVMIDGARIVTPGLLHFARHATSFAETAVVAASGWYLGYDFQRRAMEGGYDQAREDALLESIEWPRDGYRLFEIATPDESSTSIGLGPIAEANALFLHRDTWRKLGGMDERFDEPGGGLVNLDILSRALDLPGAKPVLLLGEGTFHQFHHGTATNAPPERMAQYWLRWAEQYRSIRAKPWQLQPFPASPAYIGTLPAAALSRFVHAAAHLPGGADFLPGPETDVNLWMKRSPLQSADPVVAQLVDLARGEFRAGRYEATAGVALLAHRRAPDEAEPQRLMSLLAAWLPWDGVPQPWQVNYHLAVAEAYRILDDLKNAELNYLSALTLQPNLPQAHIGLALLRMPGDFYYAWLDRLYEALAPETVVEIGVNQGGSLSRVKPPSIAIGIDPHPSVALPIHAETHIFPETSDAFFARGGLAPLLKGRPLGIGFIDGLHLYEQALKDFINLEAHCGPRSMILFHDTVPLDEATQSRTCDTQFHTGDIWKTVLCLKHYRPELDVFTIPAPWTGLTVVTGLDGESRILLDRYDEAVARFIDTPFSEIEGRYHEALNLVTHDWAAVEQRLRKRAIL